MSDRNTNNGVAPNHTPPLGYAFITPLYDASIALLTRERVWRSRFVLLIAPKEHDYILDVGSGTGSLALALHRKSPLSVYHGIDPDADATARACAKISRVGGSASFITGFFNEDAIIGKTLPSKIVSSLVLHQVPLKEKRRILETMHAVLKPGGTIHVADYGHQKPWLMRILFRLTVQVLDGVKDTQPNADGIIPELMRAVGFENVQEQDRIPTITGVISIYSATLPSDPVKID